MWSIRKLDGAVLTCELQDFGDIGIEVQMLRDGQFLFGRRWPNRAAALLEVDELKADHLTAGAVLMPARDRAHR
jgi:hypothetical protein